MQITGDRRVLRMFAQLPAAAQKRVLRPLVREGGARIAAEERAGAPRQSGLLQAAIGTSPLRVYRSGVLFITAGVRRGYRRRIETSMRGRLRYLSKRKSAANVELPVQNPAKYLHLVTGGRKAIHAAGKKVLYDVRTDRFLGRSVAAAPADPFVEEAFRRAETVVSAITSEATERILTEASSFLRS